MADASLTSFLEEVEADLEWRQKESRALEHSIDAAAEDDKPALRRAKIALLYAHLEGGFKVLVYGYIKVINAASITAREANNHVAASAWDGVFAELSNVAKKSDLFRNSFPDEKKLHTFARRAEFVGNLRRFDSLSVQIKAEEVVDTEGNLDQYVMSKILFRLGFEPGLIESRFRDLQYLRRLRNPIAHGDRETATESHCKKYEKAVFQALSRTRDLLSKAIASKEYRRAAS